MTTDVVTARITSQLLAGPKPTQPEAVVERLLAVQAQDARGARLAIRARSRKLTADAIDDAFTNTRSLVITWLNRGTLHLVTAQDYWWLHALTAVRPGRWSGPYELSFRVHVGSGGPFHPGRFPCWRTPFRSGALRLCFRFRFPAVPAPVPGAVRTVNPRSPLLQFPSDDALPGARPVRDAPRPKAVPPGPGDARSARERR